MRAALAVLLFFLSLGAALLLLFGGKGRRALHLSAPVLAVSLVIGASFGYVAGAAYLGHLNDGVGLAACVALLILVAWAFAHGYKLFVRP